jgi:hypothetical protein
VEACRAPRCMPHEAATCTRGGGSSRRTRGGLELVDVHGVRVCGVWWVMWLRVKRRRQASRRHGAAKIFGR